METRVLVVDDEKEIADLIEVYLNNEGFKVFKAYKGKEALEIVGAEKLDLAILDIMLPDVNGLKICQKIREKYKFPVMMLTAKDQEIDKITGLTLGADDYVTKPFRALELIARVKAQLRRYRQYNHLEEEQDQIEVGGIVMNKNNYTCTLNEKPLALTPTEFSVLWTLASNCGQVMTSEKLFFEVWGEKYYSCSNNTIMVHIRHLREKMNDSAENPKYIKTVWGVGYKIEK